MAMDTQLSSSKLSHLFDYGNYAAVAASGRTDEWRYYAALGLIGLRQRAIEGLERASDPQAGFYHGVTLWIDGDDDGAAHILRKCDSAHARNLVGLIECPQIRVLAQLSWLRRGSQNLIAGIAHDRKFHVTNISFHPADAPNRPYANIHDYYNPASPPHFYACQMAEWHLIPPNVDELSCPILGQTADYDMLIQSVRPWLDVFDAIVMAGNTEWHDMTTLIDTPVFTFPKCYGVQDSLPPVTLTERPDIDVICTGTVLHPFYPDKSALYHHVLHENGIRPFFLNGFVPNFNQLLACSKSCFSYLINSGGMPTKAIEALAMGCAVVVQRGSCLSLYYGHDEGLLTYDLTARDLAQAIRAIVSGWDTYGRASLKGAMRIREDFSMSRVASQYFRFLTYLAARPQSARKARVPRAQKRPIFIKGWQAPPSVRTSCAVESLRLWSQQYSANLQPRQIIDGTREVLLWCLDNRQNNERILPRLLDWMEAATHEFPSSLVLRFNYVRAALHQRSGEHVQHALHCVEETLERSAEDWDIDPADDVLPWDLFNNFFNYRKYLDTAKQQMVRPTANGRTMLTNCILASIHYYASFYSSSPLRHLRSAVDKDPDFPYYALEFARRAIETDTDTEVAYACLQRLVEGSILFIEAAAFLESALSKSEYGNQRSRFANLLSYAKRARHATVFLEPLPRHALQPPLTSAVEQRRPLEGTPIDSASAIIASLLAASDTESPVLRTLRTWLNEQLVGVMHWVRNGVYRLLVAIVGTRRAIGIYGWFIMKRSGTGLK